MKHFPTLLLSAALLFGVSGPALAWENKSAHPAINLRALEYFRAHYYQDKKAKYEHAPLETGSLTDYTGPAVTGAGSLECTTTSVSKSIDGWIEHGGFSADEPEVVMSLRHFYDPHALYQLYLTDIIGDSTVANPAIDARTWAMEGPESAGYQENAYSWRKAQYYYWLAMTSPENKSENTAKAFRALGETMHLLADMTQPAHVRNDGHPWSEPIEDAIRADKINAVDVSGTPVVSLAATNPELLFHNVATYTNENFYSNDTIMDKDSGIYPLADPSDGAEPLKFYDKPKLSDFTYKDGVVYRGDRRIMEQTLSGYILGTNARAPFHIPKYFATDYAEMLIPLAVQANAKLIDLFLPTLSLNMQLDGNTVRGNMVHTLDSVWTDNTKIGYSGPGALYCKGLNGSTYQLASVTFQNGEMVPHNVTLLPGETIYLEVKAGGRVFTSPQFTKQESVLEILKAKTNIWMDLRGPLTFSDGYVFDDPVNTRFGYSAGNLTVNDDGSFSVTKQRSTPMYFTAGTIDEIWTFSGTVSPDATLLKTFAMTYLEETKDGDGAVTSSRNQRVEAVDIPLISSSTSTYHPEYYLFNLSAHLTHIEENDTLPLSSLNPPDLSKLSLQVYFW